MTPETTDLPESLSNPARRALFAAGYYRLEQLTKASEAEIKRLHGVGPHAIKRLKEALSLRNLSFAEPQK